MFPARYLMGLGLLAVGLAGCGGAPPAAKPSAEQRPVAAKPTPTPELRGQMVQIGQIAYADWGERDVGRQSSRGLDAGDFYFRGTFLRGNPGQQLTLEIKNVGQQVHNFSLPDQRIDQDLQPTDARVEVDVTFPQDGALRFFCKYHTAQGMNGLLLVGEAPPQAAASPRPARSPEPGTSPQTGR